MKPRLFSVTSDVPENIIETIIVPTIASNDLPSLARFSQTCHLFFQGCQKTIEAQGAQKLLKMVRQANWDEAERICNANPALMFVEVQSQSNPKHKISPLRQAIKLLDTYMWEMFWEKIQHNENYMKKFVTEAEMQVKKRYINLQPLFSAYENFNLTLFSFIYDLISQQQFDEDWGKLGKKQMQFLPMHMLKEFCRPGKLLSEFEFDTKLIPRPQNVTFGDYRSVELMREHVSLDSLSRRETGPFALIRISWPGEQEKTVVSKYPGLVIGSFGRGNSDNDKLLFQRIYEKRVQDLQRIAEYAMQIKKKRVKHA